MKKQRAPKHTAIRQLSTEELRTATGGDNPGMGPYDPPAPAPRTGCWISVGGVYIPNTVTGDSCPLYEA